MDACAPSMPPHWIKSDGRVVGDKLGMDAKMLAESPDMRWRDDGVRFNLTRDHEMQERSKKRLALEHAEPSSSIVELARSWCKGRRL